MFRAPVVQAGTLRPQRPSRHMSIVPSDPRRSRSASEPLVDQLARRLAAAPVSRRGLIKALVAGMVGAAWGGLGARQGWAAPAPLGETPTAPDRGADMQAASCGCRGESFNPSEQCCTPTGLQPMLPVDLARCPDRVQNPAYPGSANGCGAEGGFIQVPDSFFGVTFRPACFAHDRCYDTCKSLQADCDQLMTERMWDACKIAHPAGTLSRAACMGAAVGYFNGVTRFGAAPFEAAQKLACKCCSGTSLCPSGQACCGTQCLLPNQHCCAGQTACNFGLSCCGSTCCALGQSCENGACVVSCRTGETRCGSTCCPAGQTCTNNTCLPNCPVGQVRVDGVCTACPSGRISCGATCCPAGQACINGACTSCQNGTVACGFGCSPAGSTCCLIVYEGKGSCVGASVESFYAGCGSPVSVCLGNCGCVTPAQAEANTCCGNRLCAKGSCCYPGGIPGFPSPCSVCDRCGLG